MSDTAPVDEQVTIDRQELDALLAVATLYLDSFADDDRMSLTEKMRFQEVEEIVAKHGRRY